MLSDTPRWDRGGGWAAHLEKSVSVSFSGVVIATGPLSGTPASRSRAHGLSYANVPVATLSRGAPVLEQKLLCDMARPSTQRYIWATTWGWHDPQPWSAACLWEGHSTSNHALASWWSGVWGSRIPMSGAGLGWDWEPLVCYSHVGGSGQMVAGAWHSKLFRQLPGWLSSPI